MHVRERAASELRLPGAWVAMALGVKFLGAEGGSPSPPLQLKTDSVPPHGKTALDHGKSGLLRGGTGQRCAACPMRSASLGLGGEDPIPVFDRRVFLIGADAPHIQVIEPVEAETVTRAATLLDRGQGLLPIPPPVTGQHR